MSVCPLIVVLVPQADAHAQILALELAFRHDALEQRRNHRVVVLPIVAPTLGGFIAEVLLAQRVVEAVGLAQHAPDVLAGSCDGGRRRQRTVPPEREGHVGHQRKAVRAVARVQRLLELRVEVKRLRSFRDDRRIAGKDHLAVQTEGVLRLQGAARQRHAVRDALLLVFAGHLDQHRGLGAGLHALRKDFVAPERGDERRKAIALREPADLHLLAPRKVVDEAAALRRQRGIGRILIQRPLVPFVQVIDALQTVLELRAHENARTARGGRLGIRHRRRKGKPCAQRRQRIAAI